MAEDSRIRGLHLELQSNDDTALADAGTDERTA